MLDKTFLVLAAIGLAGLVQAADSQPQPLEHYFSEEEIKYMKPQVIEALQEMIQERGGPKEAQPEAAKKSAEKEKQQPCLAISYLKQPAEKSADLKARTKANVEYLCRFCCRDHQFAFSYTTWDSQRQCRCTDSLLRKLFGVIEFEASS